MELPIRRLATGSTIQGSIIGTGKICYFFPKSSRLALRPIRLPIQWVPEFVPGVKRPGVKLTTHLHLAPRLRTKFRHI
jgi:hypothetical protein